jgi:hypothetical protein
LRRDERREISRLKEFPAGLEIMYIVIDVRRAVAEGEGGGVSPVPLALALSTLYISSKLIRNQVIKNLEVI